MSPAAKVGGPRPSQSGPAFRIVMAPGLESPAILCCGVVYVRPCATPGATTRRIRESLRRAERLTRGKGK